MFTEAALSSSLTLAPHPVSDGESTASQAEVSAKPYPEEPVPLIPLQGIPRLPEQTIPIPEHRREERAQAFQTEPVAIPSEPELSPSSINTDVRKHGINPFLTGVTAGIIASIFGFLIGFVYFVVCYLRYRDG
jgi:hypothetical protein